MCSLHSELVRSLDDNWESVRTAQSVYYSLGKSSRATGSFFCQISLQT